MRVGHHGHKVGREVASETEREVGREVEREERRRAERRFARDCCAARACSLYVCLGVEGSAVDMLWSCAVVMVKWAETD